MNSLRVAEDRIDDGFGAVHVDVHRAGEEMSAFCGTADGIDISMGFAVPIIDPAVGVVTGNAAELIECDDALLLHVQIQWAGIQPI